MKVAAGSRRRDTLWPAGGWVDSVTVSPAGELLLDAVRSARRFFDPVGHYNRPGIFRLTVDARSRSAVVLDDQ